MVHHSYCLADATITMLTQACDHILKGYVTVYYKLCIYYTVYSNRYPGLVALQRGSAVSPRAHSPRSEQLTPRRAAVTQLKWKLQELDTRIATANSADTAAALEAERAELVKAYDHVIAAGATCSPSGASLPRSPRAGGISPRGSSSTVGADSSVSVGFGTGYTPPPAVLLQSPPVFGKRAAATSINSGGAMLQQPPPPQQPRPTAATEQINSIKSNRSSISSSSSSSAAMDTTANTNNATTAANSGSDRVLPPPPRSPRASQQASPHSSVGGTGSVASASSSNSAAKSATNNTAAGSAAVTTAGTADMLPSPGKP
jgi:hypothetical protein